MMKIHSFILMGLLAFASIGHCALLDHIHYSRVDKKIAYPLLSKIPLHGNEKILEIGLDDGTIALALAMKVPQGQVVGIVPSYSRFKRANDLKYKIGSKNCEFVQENPEDFSLNKKFDIAIVLNVMPWIADQKKALLNIADHLTPDGKIYIVMASKKGNPYFDQAIDQAIKRHKEDFANYKNPLHLSDLNAAKKFLMDSGFHVDKIRYELLEERFGSQQELVNWLQGWVPEYHFLREGTDYSFLLRVVDYYLAEEKVANFSQIHWDEKFIVVEASKVI